jgi:hypothetical protein
VGALSGRFASRVEDTQESEALALVTLLKPHRRGCSMARRAVPWIVSR